MYCAGLCLSHVSVDCIVSGQAVASVREFCKAQVQEGRGLVKQGLLDNLLLLAYIQQWLHLFGSTHEAL